jgi:hypothetical protein
MIRQPSVQRIVQLLRRRFDPVTGQICQLAGLAHAFNHRLDDSPPARAHDVGEHRVELDVGLRQRLADALHMPRLLANELLAGAQQRAQFLHVFFRNEARLDQSAGQKIGDPHRIVEVALAARNVLDVRRIGDDQGEIPFAQNLPHRHPIDPGRLHRHVRTTTFPEPRRQRQQVVRGRGECPAFPCNLAASPNARTGNDRCFVHVETGDAFVQYLHPILLHNCTAGGGA